jgi:hypothetical protein
MAPLPRKTEFALVKNFSLTKKSLGHPGQGTFPPPCPERFGEEISNRQRDQANP